MSLNGRVALVTGGSSGIGLAAITEMLKNGISGIVNADYDTKNGQKTLKKLSARFGRDKIFFLRADISKAAEHESAFRAAMLKFKCLDIYFNNAGILNDAKWEQEIQTNAVATIRGNLLAMKYFGKNHKGSGGIVINNASVLGLMPLAGCPVYCATKHFVIGATRSFGTQYFYNVTGIKFMAICPGVTETPLVAHAAKSAMKNVGKGIAKELVTGLNCLGHQKPTPCGQVVVKMIEKGKNGSVWVSELDTSYEVDIPGYREIRKNPNQPK